MQDDQGYYKILGRHRDQINVKGKKLNPISLETQLLNNVPGLTECVVFGADSVKCLYVGTCDADDIRKYLIGLGVHCRPTLLQSVDTIPISPSGKVSRSWLDSVYSDK
jgi:acyl-coenzyme A synthetase/AMP-(fatty) acid ligase